MPDIRIKNIGPIVDTGVIELTAIMLIVGKQSSGKSTFMKILCFCRWIEKRIMLDGENLLKKYTHYGRFLKELKKFHRFDDDFFAGDSYIFYNGDCLTIEMEGGMANVYLAHDKILDRDVAIKVLRGDLENNEKFIRRFQREAKSVSDLSHPNIVEMYDVGEDNGNFYIVMEYIDGQTLKQLIKKRGHLTVPEAIDIMLQLTDGLAHAHDSYIIHRDIKPQNIMILEDGMVKITDFGIAMAINASDLTQTNSVMGSVHYLPPEQAAGKGSTIKSDIYSLGILFYEMLAGTMPFRGETAVEIALKHIKDPMPSIRKINPKVPQSVENIIFKATAKNPKNRYNNVRELHDDLKTALDKDRANEKRFVFKYPEDDLDETKVLDTLKDELKVNKEKGIPEEKPIIKTVEEEPKKKMSKK